MQSYRMLRLAATLFCIVSTASSDDGCPGGYSEGATVDIGSYWYECKNGQVVPKGCLTEDHMRVDIRETYDVNTYRMQCVLDSQNQLTIIYKACVQGGREYSVGDAWDDGKVWFTCVKDGVGLRVESSGCVENGRRLNLDEKTPRGDTIYICRKNTQAVPTFDAWGCVAKDGHHYAVGESFDFEQSWYMCSSQSGRIYVQCLGCLHEQRRLGQNDHFVRDDVIYECSVHDESSVAKPFGCIQRDEYNAKVERRLGCFWVEGQAPYQYEYTCKDQDTVAYKVPTKCIHKVTGGAYEPGPGCYVVATDGKSGVGCVQEAPDKLRIEVFSVDENGNANAPAGLRQC